MADKPDDPTGGRDNVDRIHLLVRLMRKYDLSAIDLVEGRTSIRLRRRGVELSGASMSSAAPTSYPPQSAPVATTAPIVAAPSGPAATASAPKGIAIESPMVGTFYSSSSPENPPFISVGTVVRPETTVCIIEAMKVFTEIPAGVSGTVIEILAKDKQAVEFAQPLFRVEPS